MLTESELKQIAEQTLAECNGIPAEVNVSTGDSALTRFSDSIITQNVASKTVGLTLRLLQDGHIGKATTGNLSAAGIKKCVDTARAALAFTSPDPEALPLVMPQTYPSVPDRFVKASAEATPEQRAEGVIHAIDRFKKDNLNGAGIYSNNGGAFVLANTNGLYAYSHSSHASFSISAMSEDSSGWAQDHDDDIAKVNIAECAETAAQKALIGKNPIGLEPGAYTVIFEPAAVAELLLFMAWDAFNGLAYVEERSCFSGKIGQKVVGENITVVDDAYHPMAGGQPFDFEGMPRKKVTLIENGVFKSPVHDRRTAKRMGIETTGHGLPQPDSWGPVPVNLILQPGNSSTEEMIASTKRGLLVTKLHYVNILNPMTLTLTGMTRDGLFLIEDGKVVKGLKNFRFTESVLHVLNNVEALSKQLYKTSSFWGGGGTIVPAMKVNDFHFTSKTEN
ncbi:MAG: TldD/PmbA family protein [bacterium]|nr:TldD/PmbA family protein [bacterium]